MPRIYLRVKKGPTEGSSHPLSRSVTLGRGTSADLVLPDEAVSREHATIRADGETVVVEDLDSSNGTFVNGERISSAVRLEDGDCVQIGGSELEVVVGGDDPAAPTPTEPTVIHPPGD